MAYIDLEKVLLDEASIQRRVAALAREISEDYRGSGPPVLIGVLKGSLYFLADLSRALEMPLEIELMSVSSYGAATRSSGTVRITQDLHRDIADRHVLLVEDIVDTGLTLSYLLSTLELRHPASLRVCSLLDKPSRRKVRVPIHYLGFTVPDAFVVGYGLDLDERYRNLPFIGVLPS